MTDHVVLCTEDRCINFDAKKWVLKVTFEGLDQSFGVAHALCDSTVATDKL